MMCYYLNVQFQGQRVNVNLSPFIKNITKTVTDYEIIMFLLVVKYTHDKRYVRHKDKHETFTSFKRFVLSTRLKEIIKVKTDNPQLEVSFFRYFLLREENCFPCKFFFFFFYPY